MSVFVHYDLTGRIRGFVTLNGPKGTGLMLTPKPGVLVAEAEGIVAKPGAAGTRALRELAKSHVIEEAASRVKLHKKG